MPSLGFATTLYMYFRAEYWMTSRHKFVPVPKADKALTLGPGSSGLHQDGVDFYFQPHAGLLSGAVTFEWKLGSHVIGRITRPATRGHPNADFADPRHFSAGSCRIR